MNNKPLLLLVVDDSEDDVYFMQRSLRLAAPSADVRYVSDGQSALDYLRGHGAFADRSANPLPDITFLDLKLPYVHGLDVLMSIRSDRRLREQCIIVLTSSSEERDRAKAMELGVQGYLVKPPTPAMLLDVLSAYTHPLSGN